jgi:hypothetical protein
MAESRTVTINMDAVQATQIEQITGYQELMAAIGYLSTWNMTFPRVEIFVQDVESPELLAVYKDAGAKRGYTIGAVWNGTKFGFHS